ncbi:DUF4159 domain-containing protein [Candidatus Poribacteria bacterium]
MPVGKARIWRLSISFGFLGAALLIVGSYFIYRQEQPIQEYIAETLLETQKKVVSEEGIEKQPEAVKIVTRPTIPMQPPISTETTQVVPRGAVAAAMRHPGVTVTTVLEFSATSLRYDIQIVPNVPEVKVMPNIVTYADVSTKPPEGMNVSVPVSTPTTTTVGRGIVGTQVRVARASVRPKGLTMIKNISVADTGLANVAQAVTLGKVAVVPLPKGEPGGRVIGRGKDIQGVFRLVRVQHDLADWWADQSSLISFTEWLNTQTKIKTDMNVEGGALRLTDPMLSKAPLVFFTGHDPNHVRNRKLIRGAPLRNRLTEQERNGMRKYLVEDGGFIYFDDCGVNYASEAFLRLTLAQLRYAMPEYTVDRIDNNHEIYSNYYDMGGPPVGFDIFWWGTHPPKRNFLEGITVGDHLAALICRRDYMCAMETVSIPSKAVHYSPGVYRFSTNVVMYSLTHGGISDYSHYIPDDEITDRISINAPTVVPKLE